MGLGMGHFIHTARRNLDITDLIQNNQIYGLTKGQYSPTSDAGFVTSTSPDGAIEMAANPLALALTAGGTFIARGFAGDAKGLAVLIARAVQHKGYALVEILQPCVTFNKKNTYDWYRERVYMLEDTDHDPSDRVAAFQKALEGRPHSHRRPLPDPAAHLRGTGGCPQGQPCRHPQGEKTHLCRDREPAGRVCVVQASMPAT